VPVHKVRPDSISLLLVGAPVLTVFGPPGNAPNLPQNQSDRSTPSNFHSGGSSGNNNSRSTPSLMTSAAGSQQSSSKFQGVRSSSSSKAAAQTSKTSTSSSSSSTSTGSSSSSSGSTYNGQATFYYREHAFLSVDITQILPLQILAVFSIPLRLILTHLFRPTENQGTGACGSVSSDSDKVVALQTSMYNSGSHCGETITITNTGKPLDLFSSSPPHPPLVHRN